MVTDREVKHIQKVKVIELNYSKSKSPKQITNCLEDALQHVRRNKVDSVFVCFATNKRKVSKRNTYYAVKKNEIDYESITKEIENGYELIQQAWDKLYDE